MLLWKQIFWNSNIAEAFQATNMPGSFKLKYALEIFEFVIFFCVVFFSFSFYGNLNHVRIVDLIFLWEAIKQLIIQM